MSSFARPWTLSIASILLAAAACSEQPTSAPSPLVSAPDASALLHVRCAVDVAQKTVECGPVALAGAATTHSDGVLHTFGGQGVYVNLVSSSVSYVGTTFSFNTTVQNASNLAMATGDGAARDTAGVRVFFNSPPTATSGSGAITISNPTGVSTFLATNQSYYQYGGALGGTDQPELGADGILASAEVSATKNWQFDVPLTATSFAFEVYVSTTTPAGQAATIAPQIASVNATMIPGTSAVITASNLNPTPASNAVTIGGRVATITSGTPTTLTVTVPCVASGLGVPVYVATGGVRGAASPQPLVVTQRTVAVGEMIALTSASDSYCNELTPAAGPARYLVSVLSASTSPASNSPFQLSGDPSVGPSGLMTQGAPSLSRTVAPEDGLREPTGADRELARRDAAHKQLLERGAVQHAMHRGMVAHASVARAPSARSQLRMPPATSRTFTVPNINVGTYCSNFYVVNATLVYTSGKVAIYEDAATPSGFLSANNAAMMTAYTKIGDQFNADFEPLIRNNFGDILRRDAVTDNDGLVVMLFTPRINTSFTNVAGFVISCDLTANNAASTPAVGGPYTGTSNSSSNFGEVFYGYQPTVAGTGYTGLTVDSWIRTIRATVVHEMKHLASFAAHTANGVALEAAWLEEGTARLAEEIWAREYIDVLPWKGNNVYGSLSNPVSLYCDARLTPNTPECDANPRRPALASQRPFASLYTMLFGTNARLLSPFGATASDNSSYYFAISWSLVRYAIDRYGASDAAFLTALTQSTTSSATNLTARAGVSIDVLLGGWATALYVDDLAGLPAQGLDSQFQTWNFRSVYAGLNTDIPGTYTLAYPLVPQPRTFGTFAPVVVTTLRGGGVMWYQITGTQALTQLLRLETNIGGLPSTSLRLAIARLQ